MKISTELRDIKNIIFNKEQYKADVKERLGDEGFVIKTVGEKIFILGSGVRGALYGGKEPWDEKKIK